MAALYTMPILSDIIKAIIIEMYLPNSVACNANNQPLIIGLFAGTCSKVKSVKTKVSSCIAMAKTTTQTKFTISLFLKSCNKRV